MFQHSVGAFFVHLLTASGALCALFAFVAIVEGAAVQAFWWLGLALIIDGIDGPLARYVDTKKHLPRFSGERLDLIVDYLNYVVLPAFMLVHLGIIGGDAGIFAAGLILLSALFHFSDTASKTVDGFFIGFPAVWNIVIFYFLAFGLSEAVALAFVVVLAGLTFVPIRWIHPLRVRRFRWLTLAVLLAGAYGALRVLLSGFDVGMVERGVLAACGGYFIVLSLARTAKKSDTASASAR